MFFDVVLMRTTDGLSVFDIPDMIEKLNETYVLPIDIINGDETEALIGFIGFDAAGLIDYNINPEDYDEYTHPEFAEFLYTILESTPEQSDFVSEYEFITKDNKKLSILVIN